MGSDTISTHMFHQAGILYLKRWGLLRRLLDAGTPLCRGVTFFMDGAPMEIPPEPVWGVEGTYAPRRTVLDRLGVEAAVEQGVELRALARVESPRGSHGIPRPA